VALGAALTGGRPEIGARRKYFSHTDGLCRSPFTRMTAFGYGYSTSRGENIAAGNATAAATIAQWKASTGHNQNMLSFDRSQPLSRNNP